MFLALDAGNSSTKAAVWDGTAWGEVVRIDADDTVVAERLKALARGVDAAGIASVVPRATPSLTGAVREAFDCPLMAVSASLELPFRMGYQTPETLGADRLAASAAAWRLFGDQSKAPIVILDAGTTVTLDVVTREPAYLGGAIAPGPDLLRRALGERTGQLPIVEWDLPASSIGTSTREAIQSGLTTLFADGVAGLLRRTRDQLGVAPFVVATGGWAEWLADNGIPIDRVEPTLVLDGVRLLCSDTQS